jgi:methylglutaconyl-CoA hydratase
MIPGYPLQQVLVQGESLRVEVLAHGVVRLALTRAEVRNAFDGPLVEALARVLETLALLPPEELRLLLLEGEGRVFCAGADLAHMRAVALGGEEANLQDARGLERLFRVLATFPAPVLCVVQGAALGGGLGLAACADLVLAEAGARFGAPEVRLGILPAVIGPYLVRRLGLSGASPLILGGQPVDGTEAHRLGLVNRLVEPTETIETALARLLGECLQAGPRAARRAKALLLQLSPVPDPELAEVTVRAIAQARSSPEGLSGLEAFLGRRPTPWTLGLPESP